MASINTDQNTLAGNAPGQRGWRDVIKVHPAAELFPLLPHDELRALGEDIRRHGFRHPVTFWVPGEPRAIAAEDFDDISLLDGRNRFAAAETVGLDPLSPDALRYHCIFEIDGVDPYEYVISANIHRRHLTSAQKQELIANLLRAKPERSDNATAELAKVSDKTVTRVRERLEATSEILKLTYNVGKDGKSRRRHKPVEILRDGANSKGVTLDKFIEMMAPAQPQSGNTPQTTGALICYTRNPDAVFDLDITAPIELKTDLRALPRSRPLMPVPLHVNGVPPAQNPIPAKVGKREEAIAGIVAHLHHDPTMFLSDLAMIMADDQARLARVSIHNRRAALTKITHSLGLRIADAAWKGE
jgi:hypothetical protein